MELGKHDLVGGFAPTHEDAPAAVQPLRASEPVALAGAQTHATPRNEAAALGRGVVRGVIGGVVVGAILGIVLLLVSLPMATALDPRVILLGVVIGGFWGSFFGGLTGMAITASGHDS